jgi:hypothetical protein
MSAEPVPYYPPDPPSRFRWVPPLMIGFAAGGLIGCLMTFGFTVLAQRSQSQELVAERFSPQHAFSVFAGEGDLRVIEDTTTHLGRTDARSGSGSAVRRKIRFQGSITKGGDPSAFAQQVKNRIDTELNQLGAFISGGRASSSSGGNEAKETQEKEYYSRDGRRLFIAMDVSVRDGHVEGTLVLTEGR